MKEPQDWEEKHNAAVVAVAPMSGEAGAGASCTQVGVIDVHTPTAVVEAAIAGLYLLLRYLCRSIRHSKCL